MATVDEQQLRAQNQELQNYLLYLQENNLRIRQRLAVSLITIKYLLFILQGVHSRQSTRTRITAKQGKGSSKRCPSHKSGNCQVRAC